MSNPGAVGLIGLGEIGQVHAAGIRLPMSGLMWRFLWEYNTTVLRWARWAREEVEAWPDDLSELDVTAGFSRIVSAASRPWPDQETG
jgi:hypothetical protein